MKSRYDLLRESHDRLAFLLGKILSGDPHALENAEDALRQAVSRVTDPEILEFLEGEMEGELCPPGDACPACDERCIDSLIVSDDGDRVRCASCDRVYDLSTSRSRGIMNSG